MNEEMVKVFDREEDVHILPHGGITHRESSQCWCDPDLDHEDQLTQIRVFIHRELQ